ncbi:hypothetical protein Tco_0396053 [Tanacetum coccineum]
MSDSEDSTVTYTEVSSLFEDLSDIGSPGVDGLPMMLEDPYMEAALQAPSSPDYVPGPEHPPSLVYVPYVPKPETDIREKDKKNKANEDKTEHENRKSVKQKSIQSQKSKTQLKSQIREVKVKDGDETEEKS